MRGSSGCPDRTININGMDESEIHVTVICSQAYTPPQAIVGRAAIPA